MGGLGEGGKKVEFTERSIKEPEKKSFPNLSL